MLTALYAGMHFLVDFVCAWAMFASFRQGNGAYLDFLIYNFCAFALQMPLGTLLDLMRSRGRDLTVVWTAAGVFLTLLGAVTTPWILGLGNALFHVGGGMAVIDGDFAGNRKGRSLGIFVAPGALGLYLGTCLGKSGDGGLWIYAVGIAMVLLLAMVCRSSVPVPVERSGSFHGKGTGILIRCCFLVVILRSWVGMGVSFSWKSHFALPAVLAVVLGKMLGGMCAARFGRERTIRWSLLICAGCFLLGEIPVVGMAALLLFNMTMPVTLYLLAENLPGMAGFSFGLLTFGLFLGFLPVYAGIQLPISPGVFGAVGSLVSLVLLYIGGKAVGHDRVSA